MGKIGLRKRSTYWIRDRTISYASCIATGQESHIGIRGELEVVPDEAHMTYSIVMGQETMHGLQIDNKISKHDII